MTELQEATLAQQPASSGPEGEGDPEARVQAVRRWALSLAPPKAPRHRLEDIRHMLPPLRSLKEYPLAAPDSGAVLSSARSPPRPREGAGASSPVPPPEE